MKNVRMFIEPTGKSTLFLDVPDSQYDRSFEVTMRDCSRQIHWLFSPDKKGIAKAKKVADFYANLIRALEHEEELQKSMKRKV